jgi:hypothetical protein
MPSLIEQLRKPIHEMLTILHAAVQGHPLQRVLTVEIGQVAHHLDAIIVAAAQEQAKQAE